MRIPLTAAGIRAAAYSYNARFPEAAAEIAAGFPIVDVTAEVVGDTRIRIQASAYVIAPDGGEIGAGGPHVEHVWWNNGHLAPLEYAAHALRAQLAEADVPVRYRKVKDY